MQARSKHAGAGAGAGAGRVVSCWAVLAVILRPGPSSPDGPEGQSRETGPRVCHTHGRMWPYLLGRGTRSSAAAGAWERSSQTSLETTNHEMQLSAPAQPGTPRLASPATPGRAKTRARTVVPAVDVPCPRALLQDLPQVAPGPDILTALAGVATHCLAVGWAD